MTDHAPPPGRSSKWGGIIVGAVVLFLLVGIFVPAVRKNRCGAQSIFESSELRSASWALRDRANAGGPMPRSIAELVYDGDFAIERFDRGCTECDLSKVRIGEYSARRISRKRMTREALDAAIALAHPDPIAWERFGPVVLCLDARAYADPNALRIVGWSRSVDALLSNYEWCNVAFADGHISEARGIQEPWTSGVLDESLAYYESIGIPMPAEMVAELREAMGAE